MLKQSGLARACFVGVALSLAVANLTPGAQAAPSKAPVQVTFWTAYTGKLGSTFQDLINRFQAKNPNVKVTDVVSANYTALFQKEQSAVLGGGLPSGGQSYESWTAQFAKSHAVDNLNSYITNKKVGLSKKDISDFFGPIWKDGTLGKSRYMMPFSKSDIVLYYNPNILGPAGIKKAPATWAEFAKDAQKVTKIENGRATQWGATFEISEPLWYAWEKEWGAQILDKHRHAVFASKAGLAPVNYFVNLARKKYLVFSTASGFPGEADFDAGKTAFYVGTSAGSSFVIGGAKPGVAVRVAMLPAGPKGRYTEMFGANLVVFSDASKAEKTAAWSFLKFITAPAQTAYWSINTGYMPIRKSALKLSIMKDYYKANPWQRAAAQQLGRAFVEPTFPQWTKASNDIASELGAALSLSKSPAAAMKAAQNQVNADIKSG